MKKLISYVLSMSILCSMASGITSYADTVNVGEVIFTHQNVVGSQTCYADDTDEKTITDIPDVIQGMRINRPVFRAYMDASTAGKVFTVNQMLKDSTVISSEEITASDNGVLEFDHIRNCEMIEILYDGEVVASLDTEQEYVNGVAITSAPASYQIYQRDENDTAVITITGIVSDASSVSVTIGEDTENAVIQENRFTYTKTLGVGLYDITVTSDKGEVASYKQVGVGDIWVAAGQSNMTDMGAITDGFDPDTDDPINDNMHIMYAEDCTWQQMSHPAGEGRFFKTGVRTSPVTSFAREISESETVPVGIVQSSVGGTNIYQWVTGVRDSDANSGYLMDALRSCFDKMMSHDVKGVLWYQGCNDAINENYAYNYKNLQQRVFDEMRAFFGQDVPIITTQLNDANQDSNSSQGYYDAWSFVKDVQRQNEELYDNVYVVGTGELELGDTIHNNAASNVKLGKKWVAAARNIVYGDTSSDFRQPTIDKAEVTGTNQVTLTFKNTDGLKVATGAKRIGITNSLRTIELGDLTEEFVVRKGGNRTMTASNSGKGTVLTITDADITDGNKVVLTTAEELSGIVAIDCMYGKRFSPTLVDADTNQSVLAFYNVIASYENAAEITPALEITAGDTADLNAYTGLPSDSTLYVNKYRANAINNDSSALMKFDLSGVDFSKIVSAKLAVFTENIDKDRSGNFTISEISTDWDNTAYYGSPDYAELVENEIKKININTAGIFPVGNYSSIDITDYIMSYDGSEIGIGIAADFASVLTLSGVNSEHPPMLVIQQGKSVELTYTSDNGVCSGVKVTIEGVGATEYAKTEFVTDENGKIRVNLTEGTYRATTATGSYEESSNTFTVSSSDVSESYALTVNTSQPEPTTPPIQNDGVYTFGDSYNEIKEFNTSPLAETAIGDTGFKISIDTSNWNNAVVRDKSSTNNGYYPYQDGLAENGYYLFIGSGGNSSVSATITMPETISSGRYVKITYAKPYATNNGTVNRSAGNENIMTLGNEVIDIEESCEYDAWYTTTVRTTTDISTIDIDLGKWSAVAISSIEISDSADTMELTAEGDTSELYIIPNDQTIQYNAVIYNSITVPMGGGDIVDKGTVDTAAKAEYFVNGYAGVSIDENGLLTVTGEAEPGVVTVTAQYGSAQKSIDLLLKAMGSAADVQVFGSEIVTAGETGAKYSVLPIADNGTALPARDTYWEITGDALGAEISADGLLSVPDTAGEGVITLKATLTVSEIQTEEISTEFPVTIRTANTAECPYTIQGVMFKNGVVDITEADGLSSVIIEKADGASGLYNVTVKVFDENNKQLTSGTTPIIGLEDGVGSIDLELDFENAAFIKTYITNKAVSNMGNIITSIDTDGNNITGVKIMRNTADTTNGDLIIAQYTDETLADVKIVPVELLEGENTINIADTALIPDAEVRAYLWDSTDTMYPLANTAYMGAENTVSGSVASEEIFTASEGVYKNIPLVSDWITGAKSGLGMGAGIIAPQGAPYGVDPELVDVSELNVTYTYDENYPVQTVDNALWYKTGAYLASSSGANNSIYARDAADWEQKALPIGNGYMGGMIFGLPDKDQIQINEETFWAAGYRGTQEKVSNNTVNPNMSEGINGYMSVGNIFVDFDMPKGASVNNYYRDLNLDESVAHVRYEYDGVTYNREYFASYPKEVMVFRYTSDTPGALSFTVNPVSMHPGEAVVNDGEITIIGHLKDSEPYSSGGNAAWNQESDLEYCTKIKVIADDGTVTDGYNSVNVDGASSVTVIVAAATDYDPDRFEFNADGSVDMEATPYKSERGVQAAIDKASERIDGAAAMTYEELKAEHIADYTEQFGTVTFSLTDEDEVCQTPTDELQASYARTMSTSEDSDGVAHVSYNNGDYAALDKHLEELHYNYARYLMISSSRSTTLPATLQGKWCQSTAEIWGSCYCININMEMNYWFAGGANLLDSGKALIGWFESQIPAGRVTAKNMYGITPQSYKFENGTMTFSDSDNAADDVFIMHTKQAIMGTTDMTGSTNIQSPGNTAWLMYNLWDLYQTSGDEDLLKNELYPIMRSAANFYTQYLYKNMKRVTNDTDTYPDGYYYTTWEGRSPEHGPTEEGVKYDLQLVAGMYDYTIAAAKILGVDADKAAAWEEIRDHLEIPVELGDDGQIKEWKEETSYNTDAGGNALGDPVHRHISHLVGLYPGNLINRDTPEFLEGAKTVLEKRGDDATGWSCSYKFLLWARALDGDKALELFRYQLGDKTYSNLFDTHAPFQIDGNFGSAAGVMELLMQSQTGDIYILPALPSVWDKGEISGIKAKNGAEVSIRWENGMAEEIRITPAFDGPLTIGYDKGNAFTLDGVDIDFTNGKYVINNAEAGREYVFLTK